MTGLSSNGIATRTAAATWAARTITGTAAELTVTNGDGVSGNPTLSLPNALTFTGKTITGGTFASITVSSGTITGITDIAVADGGTGASTAANARTNLGLVIGTDVQAFDADLTGLAALASTGVVTRTAANTYVERTITGTANEITLTNGSGAAGNPTVSLPAALTFTGKTVTGGTFTGITDIAVADGGTGSSTAGGARTNLGFAQTVLQRIRSEVTAVGTVTGGTHATPLDDTIPQQTNEGQEITTVTITPVVATSKLKVRFGCQVASDNAGGGSAGAFMIFRDATASAVYATYQIFSASGAAEIIYGECVVDASAVSATTFKFQIGVQASGQTITYNGASGTRLFGGVNPLWLEVEEYTV